MSSAHRGKPLFKQSRSHADTLQNVQVTEDRPAQTDRPTLHVNTKRRNSAASHVPAKRSVQSPDVVLSKLELESCLATGLVSPETVASALLSASSCDGGEFADSTFTCSNSEIPVSSTAGTTSQLFPQSGQWQTYTSNASCLVPQTGSIVPVDSYPCVGSGNDDEDLLPASQLPLSRAVESQEKDRAVASGASSPVLFESEDGGELGQDELADGVCPEDGDMSLNSSTLVSMINDITAEFESGDATDRLPLTCSYQLALQSHEPSQDDTAPEATLQSQQLADKNKMTNCKAPGGNVSAGFFGLSKKVPDLLQTLRGIPKLYDWQMDCLGAALSGQRTNWIFSMPTSGGKTLVAEVLMFTELLTNHKDVLFIVPFVSIVQEKVRGLAPFAAELDFFVEEYAASQGRIPPRKRRGKQTMYIATIEKANAVITSLLEAGRLSSLGLVVIDELHMLGDGGSRGATLESSLTLLLYASPDTWLVGMSATLSNIHQLQEFLSAQLFTSDFRPVKLVEHVMVKDKLFRANGSGSSLELVPERQLTAKDRRKTDLMLDPDCFAPLVLEAILSDKGQPSHSCLVFCATKKSCQNVASMLAKVFKKCHKSVLSYKSSQRRGVVETLKHEAGGECCPVLLSTVPAGVAYHHSGLTADERKVIEEAFSSDLLCVLCSTTTLAAGVNLPARRVILRSPRVGRSLLSLSQYKQMVGRAGRAGLDTTGDSILIVKEADAQQVYSLLQGPFSSCETSLLSDGGKTFRRFLLSLIGLKIAVSDDDLQQVIQKTLWRVQCNSEADFLSEIRSNLQLLLKAGFIRRRLQSDGTMVLSETSQQASDTQSLIAASDQASMALLSVANSMSTNASYIYRTTTLGMATMKGSLDVSVAPIAYRDMLRSLRTISLSTDLHLLYLVTPVTETANLEPDWMIYLQEVTRLQTEEAHVAQLLGVTDASLAQRASGRSSAPDKSAGKEMVYRRFYLTLLLYHLLKERSVWDVASMFSCSRGFVQNLMTSAASFASCLLNFTEGLKELQYIHILLPSLVRRLSFAVRAELLPLMEIPGIRPGRARQLHASGFRSLKDVAQTSVSNLVSKLAPISKKQAMQLLSAAKISLQEKVESLREEADDLLAATQASGV